MPEIMGKRPCFACGHNRWAFRWGKRKNGSLWYLCKRCHAKNLVEVERELGPPTTEVRDGKVYKVIKLPEVTPPRKRSSRTRFHYDEVGKPGDTGDPKKPRKRRR